MPRPYNLILGEGTTKNERGLGDTPIDVTNLPLSSTLMNELYNPSYSENLSSVTTSQSSLLLWVGVGLLALVVLPHIGSR